MEVAWPLRFRGCSCSRNYLKSQDMKLTLQYKDFGSACDWSLSLVLILGKGRVKRPQYLLVAASATFPICCPPPPPFPPFLEINSVWKLSRKKISFFYCAEGALHLGNGLISSWWAIDCFSLSDQTSINAIDQQSQTAETVLRHHWDTSLIAILKRSHGAAKF